MSDYIMLWRLKVKTHQHEQTCSPSSLITNHQHVMTDSMVLIGITGKLYILPTTV